MAARIDDAERNRTLRIVKISHVPLAVKPVVTMAGQSASTAAGRSEDRGVWEEAK